MTIIDLDMARKEFMISFIWNQFLEIKVLKFWESQSNFKDVNLRVEILCVYVCAWLIGCKYFYYISGMIHFSPCMV